MRLRHVIIVILLIAFATTAYSETPISRKAQERYTRYMLMQFYDRRNELIRNILTQRQREQNGCETVIFIPRNAFVVRDPSGSYTIINETGILSHRELPPCFEWHRIRYDKIP